MLHSFFLGFMWALHQPQDHHSAAIEVEIQPVKITSTKPQLIPTHVATHPTKKVALPAQGISRNSTVETNDKNAPTAKIGNTLNKAPDNLPPSDEGLPAPAEDYEISVWPQLQNDARVPYPTEAKRKGVEGIVIMDLYIAEDGKVRKATLVKGPGFGLNEAALTAVQKFIFSPAVVSGKPRPVVIRYSYNFVIQK